MSKVHSEVDMLCRTIFVFLLGISLHAASVPAQNLQGIIGSGDKLKKITGDMMRELRSSQLAPDQKRIYTAGEKEYENTLYVLENGVDVAPGVQKALIKLRQELNLPDHNLGF